MQPEEARAAPLSPTGAARALRLVERGLLFAGTALFFVLLWQIGIGAVWENLRGIGWGIVVILAQEILAAIVNTLGWWYAFAPPRPAIPCRTLLAARIVGDGINCVTPTATIGGEFVRARMLETRFDPTAVWASVAVAKISQSVAQVVFILVGLLYVVAGTTLPAPIRRGLFVAVPLFSGLVLLTVVLQRRGLFTSGVRLLRRVGVRVPERVAEALRHLDAEVLRIYEAPGSFLASTAWFFVGWLVGVLEIYLILHFLGVGASVSRAFTVEALSITVDAVFFFVPVKAGTQEGGKVLIFSLLGLDPAKGFALGLTRRLRELTWAGIGLVILSRHELAERQAAAVQRQPA